MFDSLDPACPVKPYLVFLSPGLIPGPDMIHIADFVTTTLIQKHKGGSINSHQFVPGRTYQKKILSDNMTTESVRIHIRRLRNFGREIERTIVIEKRTITSTVGLIVCLAANCSQLLKSRGTF